MLGYFAFSTGISKNLFVSDSFEGRSFKKVLPQEDIFVDFEKN